ncbi:MAG TPA: YIP1 family protein [Thermoanaerobaculia bacterium]|jgi:hypothetical protein
MALEDSSFGRVIGALVSPGRTFRSLAERPTWGVALAIILVVSTLVGVLANQRIDPNDMRKMVQQRLEKSQGGQATPEQVDRAVEIGQKISAVTIWLIPIFVVLVYLIVAVLFWGAFRFFGGSDFSYKASFATAVHAFLPGMVAALLALPLILTRPHISIKEAQGGVLASNLGAFAPDSMGPALRTLLSSLDFFSIWTLCLLVIGYRATARVSAATAAVTAVVLWAVYVGCRVGMAALFQ